MKRIIASLLFVAVFVLFAAPVTHGATAEEAKAMAQKAKAFYKANGKEKAIAEFNDPKGQFVKGDIYIVVQGYDDL